MAGYKPGKGLSHRHRRGGLFLLKKGMYILASEKNPERTSEEMIDFYARTW